MTDTLIDYNYKLVNLKKDIEKGLISDDEDDLYKYHKKHIEPIKIMLFIILICSLFTFLWILIPILSPSTSLMISDNDTQWISLEYEDYPENI